GRKSSEVRAGTSQARHESFADGVERDCSNNGNRLGYLLYGAALLFARSEDQVHPALGKLARHARNLPRIPVCRAIFNEDVLALDVAQIAQALQEPVALWRRLIVPGRKRQVTDVGNSLGANGNRRGDQDRSDQKKCSARGHRNSPSARGRNARGALALAVKPIHASSKSGVRK